MLETQIQHAQVRGHTFAATAVTAKHHTSMIPTNQNQISCRHDQFSQKALADLVSQKPNHHPSQCVEWQSKTVASSYLSILHIPHCQTPHRQYMTQGTILISSLWHIGSILNSSPSRIRPVGIITQGQYSTPLPHTHAIHPTPAQHQQRLP